MHMDRQENKRLQFSSVPFHSNGSESNMRKRGPDLEHPGMNVLPQMHSSLNPTPVMYPVAANIPPMPQNSEMMLTPEARDLQRMRVRASKACDRCRGQKIKCSGDRPCLNCSKHNKECQYLRVGETSGKPTGRNLDTQVPLLYGSASAAPAPDQLYVMHLENRVRYLELLLTPHLTSVATPHIKTGEPASDKEPILNAVTSKWRFLRRHQNRMLSELSSSLYRSLSDENKALVTLPRSQYFGWNLSGVKYVPSEPIPTAPQLDVDQRFLVDYFFQEINCLYGIIHEPVFREQLVAYNELMQEEADKKEKQESTKFNHAHLFLAQLYLIYALSIRFSEFSRPQDPRVSALEVEVKAFRYGYTVTNLLSFEWDSFELIQSWMLTTMYLRVCHRQTSSYLALNRMSTMVKMMGLGQTFAVMQESTLYEKLKAKRIFWAAYTMERIFGLQNGRYGALTMDHIRRPFPTLDYSTEDDTWLPKTAFALLHVGRIANFVHTADSDDYDLVKYQQVEKEIEDLQRWFEDNEFADVDLFSKNRSLTASGLAMAQVKLHFYDLIICVHGKAVFDFLGERIVNEGLRLERVFYACEGVLNVLERVHRAKLLYTPWYQTLLLLFNVGVISLTLIHGGQKVQQCKAMFRTAVRLISVLQKAAVYNEQGKVQQKNRYTMARECLWALKMTSRTLSLRFQQDFADLNHIGVDHGSSEVNKQHFGQIGIAEEDYGEGSSTQPAANSPHGKLHPLYAPSSMSQKVPDIDIASESLASSGVIDENFHLSSLQWFDQWIDFNYDI